MKISIITPNYNYSKYLTKLIESICEQDYEKWEHIIVDDGSTDNSVDIVNRFAQKEKRIKLIRQKNKGQSAALNHALEFVTGDLIGWINSDDWYCRGVFKTLVKEFENDGSLDIVYGNGYLYKVRTGEIILRKQLPFNYKLFAFTGFGKSIMSNTLIWKRDLLLATYNFDENMKYNMDGEYFARLCWRKKVKHINVPVAYFRWHEEAKTIKNRGDQRTESYFNELQIEMNVSLNNMNKSKIRNDKVIKYARLYYSFKRIFLRFLMGHYFMLP